MVDAVRISRERVLRLEATIEEFVPQWSLAPVVQALQALRGIDLIVAVTFAVEIGDLNRSQHLSGYSGVLQTDGYGTHKALAKGGAVKLAFCWTHTHRYFHKLLDKKTQAKTPIAAEAIARIGHAESRNGGWVGL